MKKYSEEELKKSSFTKKQMAEALLMVQADHESMNKAQAVTIEKNDSGIEVDLLGTPPGIGTVVIPYCAAMAKGEELLFAVRAWEKSLDSIEKIVIIGDRPDFEVSDLVHVIEFEIKSDNPQVDIAHKLQEAILSDEIPENFIWSNDDIYPLRPMNEGAIMLPTANGPLLASGDSRVYNLNRKRTISALTKAGLSRFDYATHTPVIFNKKELAIVLSEFDCLAEGHLISSLYFNRLHAGAHPFIVDNSKTGQGEYIVSVYKPGISPEALEGYCSRRLFLNNNDRGWLPVKKYLESRFNKKSRFEA